MPYTLLKFLLWFGLAGLIGGVIGWLLRSLKCRAEIADAGSSVVDGDDVDRMRHRLANLEQVVAERDRLRMQVADLRAADSPGIVGVADLGETAPGDPRDDDGDDAADDDADDDAADDDAAGDGADERNVDDAPSIMPGDAVSTSDHESADSVTVADIASTDDERADNVDDAPDNVDDASDHGAGVSDAAATLDLAAAASVLGKKIRLDDLTVVEGIGPKISELCKGIEVDTWRQLADTEVVALRSMLDAAGPRYQVHTPDTWPRQAELLATGQWNAFKEFIDELSGGR